MSDTKQPDKPIEYVICPTCGQKRVKSVFDISGCGYCETKAYQEFMSNKMSIDDGYEKYR